MNCAINVHKSQQSTVKLWFLYVGVGICLALDFKYTSNVQKKKFKLKQVQKRCEQRWSQLLHGGGDRELVVFYERFIGRPFEVHTDPSDESFQGPVWFWGWLCDTQRAGPPETGDTTECMSCRCYAKHTHAHTSWWHERVSEFVTM